MYTYRKGKSQKEKCKIVVARYRGAKIGRIAIRPNGHVRTVDSSGA